MKITVFFLLLVTAVCLRAQTTPETSTPDDALKLRSEMADAIASGVETSAAALVRLKAAASPSGLAIEADADFALAAIDLGQRLLVLGELAEAEQFFREAETSLVQLVQRTADSLAKTKALYLRKLSFIRGNYLNEAAQAKQDIEQALTLQPEDQRLKKARDTLGKSNAPVALPANSRS